MKALKGITDKTTVEELEALLKDTPELANRIIVTDRIPKAFSDIPIGSLIYLGGDGVSFMTTLDYLSSMPAGMKVKDIAKLRDEYFCPIHNGSF